MKKLMIAVAAVAMGIAANAATVSWSANGIVKTDHQATESSYTAYLINAAVWATATDAIAGLKGETPTAGVLMSAQGVAQGTTGKVKFQPGTQSITGTWNEGDVLKSYLLIIDDTAIGKAANYMVAQDTNTKATTFSAAGLASPTFGSQAANSWTAVPEPTSGLLLLLGVAGLALRRRRA